MNRKPTRTFALPIVIAGILALAHGHVTAQADDDAIAVLRNLIKADRQETVAQALQLTDTESQAFWPLYHQYRAEMDKVGDGLLKLVQDYAKIYPEVPEDRAKRMLKELVDLEKQRQATRVNYLKKFSKELPAAKNLRFAQVENRLDLAVQLKLASSVPLVPIEGRLSGDLTGTAAVVQGVAGGVLVQTYELTATVAAINKNSRKLTLVSPDGIKQTVTAGPEVINFDQIRLGDQVKVMATEELVVSMAGSGESADDGTAALVALAPKGAKPGGVIAETTQATAKVTAIDPQKRTATLQFEDGSTKTFPVRSDIDLGKRKVGDKVVFRVTETLAISVQKP